MWHSMEESPVVPSLRQTGITDYIGQAGEGGGGGEEGGGPMHKQWTSLDNSSAWLIGVASYTSDSELLMALTTVQGDLIRPMATHVSKDGRTLLHVTAIRERMASLEFLVKNAPGEIDAKDGDGYSPLYACITHTSMSAARLLVHHGADVSETVCRLSGETILHRMVKAGRTKTVEFLLDSGALVNATTVHGDTALHFAARYDRHNMAVMLLDAGSDINAVNDMGETALHVAINNNSMDLAKLFIKRKSNVNIKDKRGMTALHVAVTTESLELVRMMLSTNSSHINTKEQLLGRTPLLLACSNGTNKMASLLLEHGADANLTTNYRKSVLHVAASNGNTGVLKTVIKSTSNLNTLAINNMTALHYAVCGGHTDIVRVLLRSGVSSNMKDIHGMSSLHMASSDGNRDIVSALLQHDVQVNATNMEQQTALHVALSKGHRDVGAMLVGAGTDVNLLDIHDKTAENYYEQFCQTQRDTITIHSDLNRPDSQRRTSRNEDGHLHVHFDQDGSIISGGEISDDRGRNEINTRISPEISTDDNDKNRKLFQTNAYSQLEESESRQRDAIIEDITENNDILPQTEDESENNFVVNGINTVAITDINDFQHKSDNDSVTKHSIENSKTKDKKFKRRNSSHGKGGHKTTKDKKVTGSKRHSKSASKHGHTPSKGKTDDTQHTHHLEENHDCQRSRRVGIISSSTSSKH